MTVRPIRDERDYQAALEEIERLLGVGPGTPDGDEFEVLATLVEDYEERHHPVPQPDPIEAIQYHLESRGLTPDDLIPCLGSRDRVVQVLGRRRALSMGMIRKLHKALGIPADILIQPYAVTPPGERDRARRLTGAAPAG